MPTTDAWTVLAGLARETERIGLGALVSPVTFRHPGNFAKVVTTVDEMSGGRVEVGVGAGWNDLEHRQLGLPFPPIKERADLLEDQLAILHGLWGEPDGWSFEGHAVTVEDALFQPKPVDVPGRPVGAERRATAADHHGRSGLAAWPADRRSLGRRVQPLVDRAGDGDRDLREARRRVPGDRARPGRALPLGDGRRADRPDRGRGPGARGGPARDLRRGRRWRRLARGASGALGRRDARRGAGDGPAVRATRACERIMLQDFLPWDLDMIDLMGEALVGQV